MIGSFLAGGVLGWVYRNNQLEGVTLVEAINELREREVGPLAELTFSAGTARVDVEVAVQGSTLIPDTAGLGSPFSIRLNDKNGPRIDPSRIAMVRAPFYRLFISNQVGAGSLRLFIGKGVEVEMREMSRAELAIRTAGVGRTSPVERRGEVVQMDNMRSSVIHWLSTSGGSGSGAAVAVTTDRSYGDQLRSLKLTTNNGNDASVTAYKHFWLPPKGRIGVEAAWSIDSLWTGAGSIYYEMQADFNIVGSVKPIGLRMGDGGSVEYLTFVSGVSNSWVSLGTQVLEGGTHFWHKVKLVYDWVADKYVRAIIDGTEYDMASKDGGESFLEPSSLKLLVNHTMRAPTSNSSSRVGYVGDFILTQNEP